MIRIAIAGCNGKMGRQLIQSISQMHGVKLTAAFVREGSSLIGCDAGELVGIGKCGVNITDSPYHAKDKFDVLIDFTRPTGTLTYLSFCVENKKMMVIGTTGFSDSELEQIKQAAEHIGIVFSANFSIGVNLLLKLLETTTAVIGEETDIEIIETHHRHKVDSPSGTALAMGNIIAQTLGQDLKKQAVFCRNGDTGARTKNEIGFSTIRAGDIIGEHTALFAAIGERIEITHKASSRMTFSNGAVRAAMWLPTKPIGLYDMQDVLNLSNK